MIACLKCQTLRVNGKASHGTHGKLQYGKRTIHVDGFIV